MDNLEDQNEFLNLILSLKNKEKKPGLFQQIKDEKLSSDKNKLYNLINNKTKEIYSFLDDSIKRFHTLFNDDLKDFDDCLKYLENKAIPNKCICAGVIDNIPGWRCVECSKYENAIYCNECYIKSKDAHKNHKVLYLFSSSGMCDCGDPDSLTTFCPDHSGPLSDQKQIDEYISNSFEKEILDRLKYFFDHFFLRFSEYLILTEKCEYFYQESENELNEKTPDEKNDVMYLKDNFGVVFQNMIHFLRLISQKNLGMLNLIANYFLKNHFENQKLGDEYYTTHRCLKITKDDIKLFHEDKQSHICVCPFFRLFMSNYRDNIKSNENENEQFLLSFAHNLPLRTSYCVIFFAIYKEAILNNNDDILFNRHQFFLEDITCLIAEKTHLIEESFEILYDYYSKNIKSPKEKNDFGSLNDLMLHKLGYKIFFLRTDTKYFSKPKVKKLMTEKTSLMKRVIDMICLIHNEKEFKSIVPHPQFQNKGCSSKLIELEIKLLDVVQEINIFIDWEKIDIIKEFITYLINKILNQEKEGIKQLEDDEFSFHLGLYRCFGIIMNAFCFYYSFNKNCSLMDSVNVFKENFFSSKEQVEQFINIIIKDYFKLFGFIAGAKNNYFNYYESLYIYSNYYFLSKSMYIMDFSLLKYLFVMKEKFIELDYFLQSSNVEDVYSSFKDSFILENKKKDIEENKKANAPAGNNNSKNNDINNNLNDDNNVENTNDTQNEFNENLLQILRNNLNRQINVNLINQLILNRNRERNPKEEKATDENNCIMQWRLLFEMLIVFLKDDSCPYSNLMKNYGDSISSKTKADLFNKVRSNKLAMEDLGNILKEKLIHEIIAEGNLIDLKKISKNFDNYLEILFEEDNKFNEVLDELTYNKMNGDIKMFYLKDSYLKYLDINYYFSFKDKSNAQRYILDFKKDIIKSYNSYFYKPSELTFDFYEKIYEKILLSKDNLELMIKIIKKLLSEQKILEYLDIKSVRSSLLPIMLNYFSMFAVINSKAFIEFKMENQKLITELNEILSNYIKNNKGNNIIEKDLEDNVNEVLSQLNRHQIIFNSFNGDLSKLEKYNYNTDLEKITQNNKKDSNINSINVVNDNYSAKVDEDKKKKSKNMKNKFKNLMVKKANLFMEKVSSNTEIIKEINEHNKNEEKNSNDEMMCFFCRNPIKLNSFEEPYGKIGLQIDDSFYCNSVIATIRTELDKLANKENKTIIYKKMIDNFYYDLYNRIISCGHYFHLACFTEGCSKHEEQFVCPLCLRNQNILIPPLNNFKQKYSFLKSENFEEIFKGQFNSNLNEQDKDAKLFDKIVEEFLNRLDAKKEHKDYSTFLESIYPYYKSYFNFLENIFYMDGTTFHKYQQIDTFQNFILLLRFLINTNNMDKSQIVDYIKTNLCNLVKGSSEDKYIYNNNENYMDLFQKILLSLSILFDYGEMKNIFKYIILVFLPYFSFGFYYRSIMFKKENENMKTFDFNEKMKINELKKYLLDENSKLLYYFNDFLKKFLIVKLSTDFTNKNECIINTFNELSTKNLISFLEMDELFKFLPSDEIIKLNDIINNLPQTFNENEIFYKLLGGSFNHDNVVNSLFSNVIKFSKEQNITNLELVIQFAPIKFGFTYLDNNIFDWIERNVGKECDICHRPSKYSFICLLCGSKVCHSRTKIFDITLHTKKCGGKYCLFVDMDNMKVYIWSNNQQFQKLSSIYVNKAGIGPRGLQFDNEFNLSHEKLSTIMKNYACIDFHLN